MVVPMFSGSSLLVMYTADVMGRWCGLEIQNGSQITGSTNDLLVLQIYAYMSLQKQYMQGFTTMYETSKSPAIMANATSCRKSKMAAN